MVVVGYSNAQTVQFIDERYPNCSTTSVRSGRCIVWVSETIF